MPFFDLPLDELRAYAPDLPEPDDLDAFWAATLAETRAHDLAATFEPVDDRPGRHRDVRRDVRRASAAPRSGAGSTGRPGPSGPLPAVVEYLGYGGGRGLPHERTLFAQAGYVHARHGHARPGLGLVARRHAGSGRRWRAGRSGLPDPWPGRSGRPLLPPRCSPTRSARSRPRRRSTGSTPARIAVTGRSQGGALSLAVAALAPERDRRDCAPDVPFLCDIERAIGLVDTDPYAEVARYLAIHRDQVSTALCARSSYVDVARLGRRATAPALFSVGLMDDICPPRRSTRRSTPTAARPRSPSTPTTTTTAAGRSTRSASSRGWPAQLGPQAGLTPAASGRPWRPRRARSTHHPDRG